MARGMPLRTDDDADDLRVLAPSTDNAKQARRRLALSLIYEGNARGSGRARQRQRSDDP